MNLIVNFIATLRMVKTCEFHLIKDVFSINGILSNIDGVEFPYKTL